MDLKKTVTVLMPTINYNFAAEALASLQAQTHKNLEIIISDNTIKGDVYNSLKIRSQEEKIPVVNLIHSYQETNGDIERHHQLLINKVKNKYFKFLFDDDLLSPLSVQHLYEIAEEGDFPAVFHNRYNFSDRTANLAIPQALLFQDSIYKKLSFEEIAATVFSFCFNIFSEPSFSLYRSDTVNLMNSGIYIDGMRLRYLGDVALPMLVAEKFGDIAISSARLGYFRRHPEQDSSLKSPARLSGLVEWELISRYLNQKMRFSTDLLNKNKVRLRSIYQKGEKQFPFLMERYERIILRDENYVISQEFKEFFKKCKEFQSTALCTN